MKVFYILATVLSFAFLIFIGGAVFALEDTFTISQVVISSDNTPPTTPLNFSATAISSSQINLAWNASTDNVAVAGYKVFRDNSFIATTTSALYSDTALSPSTTYLYNVLAFDASFNFSTTSATSTATTLDVTTSDPAPTQNNNNSGGSSSKFSIENISTYTEDRHAIINFTTNVYSRIAVYWGTTPDYEIGALSGVVYQLAHEIRLEKLLPGTNYFVKIEATNASGRVVTETVELKTTDNSPALPPANLPSFKAVELNGEIKLTWEDVSKLGNAVRIVRSDRFFPVDPFDGKVIYEGSDKIEFYDRNTEAGVTYYYTLFVKNSSEEYSSGVMGVVRIGMKESRYMFEGIPYSGAFSEALKNLTLVDFEFIQKGEFLSYVGAGIAVEGDTPLSVRIEAKKIPLGIKTLTVTLHDREKQNAPITFLLSRTAGGAYFEGVLEYFQKSGTYEIEINLFDSKNQNVKTIYGVVQVKGMADIDNSYSFFMTVIMFIREQPWIIVVIIISGLIGGLIARLI